MTRKERQARQLRVDAAVWRWMISRSVWISAKQLARTHGEDWRLVCRSLKRLARRGKLDEETRSWYDGEGRLRECSIYRRTRTLHAAMPEWAVPRVLPHSAGNRRTIVQLPD